MSEEAPPVALEIPESLLKAMVTHCQRSAPIEACGLLGGFPPAKVDAFYPLRNTSRSETKYDADPSELIAAVREMRTRQAEILAIYHSHPKWQAIPSQTDLAENYYEGVPRIIVSLLDEEPDVRIWRLFPNSYEELPWRVVEG
jgi:[CysO sulfur-carrier protein]-S-L-cysteine hydrolase